MHTILSVTNILQFCITRVLSVLHHASVGPSDQQVVFSIISIVLSAIAIACRLLVSSVYSFSIINIKVCSTSILSSASISA